MKNRIQGSLNPPGRRQRAAGWAWWTCVTTTALVTSFNVSSLTDNGTGDTTVTWATPLATALTAYCTGQKQSGATGYAQVSSIKAQQTPTTTAVRIQSARNANVADDAERQGVLAMTNH